jgi:hypothetical protein
MKKESELDSMPIREDESAEVKNVDCVYDPVSFRKSITTIKGKVCPCCGRLAKYYHRKLTANQCLALLHILKWYRTEPNAVTIKDDQEIFEFFSLDEMFKDNPKLKKDFTLLMYFDLIEHKGRMDVKGKRKPKEVVIVQKGFYRISVEGVKFAQRETAIPITAIVYNGKVEAHKLYPYKTIEEILSEAGYDYDTIIDTNYQIQ